MCTYLSQNEEECPQNLKIVFKEQIEKGSSQMESAAYLYAFKWGYSLQKAVYHVIPEL